MKVKAAFQVIFPEEDISASIQLVMRPKKTKKKRKLWLLGCVPLKFSYFQSEEPAQKFHLQLLLKSDVSSCLGYCDLYQFLSVQILIPFSCNENLSFTCNNTSKLKFVALHLSKVVTPQFVVLLYLKKIFVSINPCRIVLNLILASFWCSTSQHNSVSFLSLQIREVCFF